MTTGVTPPTFGLLAPLSPLSTDRHRTHGAPDELTDVVRSGVVDALWLRDLPVVPESDADAGQGTDPLVHLGHLAGAGVLPPVVGTASVILGIRHPLVLARAALTVQSQTGGRLVLGVGSGGKPAMNSALGIDGQSLTAFASEWWCVRRALQGDAGDGVRLDVPGAGPPPPVYLATTDTERWRAVDGDPDGWLAFATEEARFESQLAELGRISGGDVAAAVRFDATVVHPSDAPTQLAAPERGRVEASLDQLAGLLARWRRMPALRGSNAASSRCGAGSPEAATSTATSWRSWRGPAWPSTFGTRATSPVGPHAPGAGSSRGRRRRPDHRAAGRHRGGGLTTASPL